MTEREKERERERERKREKEIEREQTWEARALALEWAVSVVLVLDYLGFGKVVPSWIADECEAISTWNRLDYSLSTS